MGRRPKTYVPENAKAPTTPTNTPPKTPTNTPTTPTTTPKEPLKSLCYNLNDPSFDVLNPNFNEKNTSISLKIYKYSFITHKYSQEIPVSEALKTFKTPYLISYFGHKGLFKDSQLRDTANDFWQKTTHICPICGEKTPLSMFQIDENIRLTIVSEPKKRSKNTENVSENNENIESSSEKSFNKQSIFNQILNSEPLLVCGKCSQKAQKERMELIKKAYETAYHNSNKSENDLKNDLKNESTTDISSENPPKKRRGRPPKNPKIAK